MRSSVTIRPSARSRLFGAGFALLAAGTAGAVYLGVPHRDAKAADGPAAPAPGIPVSVARVEPREATQWDEFSGRLEAVERVEVRSRVAGAILAVHFAEGELVKAGDLLVTIDPAPYAAEVQRLEAQVAAAQARISLTVNDLERGQRLWDSRTVTQRDLDTRVNAAKEAEANVKAAEAALQAARLNLGYTEVRAPVSGRVGRREITVGNLVPAGAGAPFLTTLVSVDPIYASFNADENVVLRALNTIAGPSGQRGKLDRIPVEMATATREEGRYKGHLQLIDNQVDGQSGTVRVRAVFPNPDGRLLPGQFARVRMGQAKTETLVMIDERAIGTDQDKKFVMVVGGDNKATYRPVTLGGTVDGLRVVTSGLAAGDRIVVNGLQRIRPGALVDPQQVSMGARPGATAAPNRLAQN